MSSETQRYVKSVIAKAAVSLGLLAASYNLAQAEDNFKIGYLADLNGPTSSVTGPNALAAAQMAVEDFGGTALGRKIEVLVADHQNKPDVGSAIVREWFDSQDVNAVFDVSQSALAFAVRDLAVARKRVVGFTIAMSSDLTSSKCSPYTFSWGADTYSGTRALTDAIYQSGGKKWYYLAVDYTFGKLLESESSQELKKLGGEVLGTTYAPFGTTDFSSNLLQASAAQPEVLAFANSVSDMINSAKQSLEFGVTARKAFFVFNVTDADAIGLANIQGAQFVDGFYWDMDDETRAFTKRFMAKTGKDIPPTGAQANSYSVVLHYLKAVQAAGTTDADAVTAKMRELPVNDFYTKNARIREDGKLMRDMYLMEAKTVDESKSRWDLFKVVKTIPNGTAFMPAEASACPVFKK